MSTSKHTLTIHDPATGTDRQVTITLQGDSGRWRYEAWSGGEFALAHGENLWFRTEAEVLALAREKVREAIRRSRQAGAF